MKINEVESMVGITKKNIRFYEEQGLLSPERNAENGYREYSLCDVRVLRRIKLLRKLGVPMEEIRMMQNGTHTLGDGMHRHLVSLEREKQNTEQSIQLCKDLQKMDISLEHLDAEEILLHMEDMEKAGTSFQNKQKHDMKVRYVAPVVVAVFAVGLLLALCGMLLWGYRVAPEEAPPPWLLGLMVLVLIGICVGVMSALTQRIREIGKGEMDYARKY